MTKKSPIILFSLLALAFSPADARKIRQTMPQLQKQAAAAGLGRVLTAVPDSVLAEKSADIAESFIRDDALLFSRYDKPSDATREAIFITNQTSLPVVSVTFQIDYLVESAVVHSRQVTVPVELPGGETRKVDFPSWDSQKSYHYIGSRAPKRRPSTPYSIRLRLLSLTASE